MNITFDQNRSDYQNIHISGHFGICELVFTKNIICSITSYFDFFYELYPYFIDELFKTLHIEAGEWILCEDTLTYAYTYILIL